MVNLLKTLISFFGQLFTAVLNPGLELQCVQQSAGSMGVWHPLSFRRSVLPGVPDLKRTLSPGVCPGGAGQMTHILDAVSR